MAKQALPYIRCIGESWPLSLDRAMFESNALKIQRNLAPELVPEVYHFDKRKALIVMRYIEPPNLILRKHLIAGASSPTAYPGNIIALCHPHHYYYYYYYNYCYYYYYYYYHHLPPLLLLPPSTTATVTSALSSFAAHVGTFMARTLFGTSALAMDGI